MSHFSPSDWVDSVRGFTTIDQSAEMSAHLEQKCPECMQASAFWELLAELLIQEKRYRPPAQLLHAVESAYHEQRPWRWLEAAARWAELVFDSIRQPLPAFVRGMAQPDRHLIYEARPFVIDVTLSVDSNQDRLSMIGQVLNSDHPEQTSTEIHIVLLSGGDLIARTVASEGGEFEIDCESRANLTLFISIRGERAIGLSLYDSTKDDESFSASNLRKLA